MLSGSEALIDVIICIVLYLVSFSCMSSVERAIYQMLRGTLGWNINLASTD